jgi:hypothetical protein
MKFADLARGAGLAVELHFLDVPAGERWRRIEARNATKAETYQLSFDVTREMFDFVESIWEPPTQDEIVALDGTVIAGEMRKG